MTKDVRSIDLDDAEAALVLDVIAYTLSQTGNPERFTALSRLAQRFEGFEFDGRPGAIRGADVQSLAAALLCAEGAFRQIESAGPPYVGLLDGSVSVAISIVNTECGTLPKEMRE